MNRIDIPQAKSVETLLQRVDSVHRYADLMMAHVTTPMTLLDVPFPIYVLRSIAYAEKDTFEDMHDLVEILMDIAYMACTVVTSAGRNGAVTKNCTCTSSEMKDIHLMMAELTKRVSSHKNILPQLQAVQEVDTYQCWDSYNQLTKKKIVLRSQDKKLAMLKDSYDVVMRRRSHYKVKVERFTAAHNTVANTLSEMLYKERRLRMDMEELTQELHELLRVNIEIRFRKTLETMATTINLVDLERSNPSYQDIKSRIQTLDVRDMVETLLRNCCINYEYPNIQEIIKATGFLETLPMGHMMCQRSLRQVKLGDDKFMTSSMKDFGGDVEVDGDRNTNNGCYLRAVGSNHSPGPEFLKLKREHTFKQKLTVMNGDVAFGWSRKGRFGQKKWGFYYSRLVSRVV